MSVGKIRSPFLAAAHTCVSSPPSPNHPLANNPNPPSSSSNNPRHPQQPSPIAIGSSTIPNNNANNTPAATPSSPPDRRPILYRSPLLSPIEEEGEEECGRVQHLHHNFLITAFTLPTLSSSPSTVILLLTTNSPHPPSSVPPPLAR